MEPLACSHLTTNGTRDDDGGKAHCRDQVHCGIEFLTKDESGIANTKVSQVCPEDDTPAPGTAHANCESNEDCGGPNSGLQCV